jgi:thiamine biosynthesis lipoprotein ApbE
MQKKTLLIILGNLAVISFLAVAAVLMLKSDSSNSKKASTNVQPNTVVQPTPTVNAQAAAAAEMSRQVDENLSEIDKVLSTTDIDKLISELNEKDFQ